ncbi:MAG: phosphoribosyl-AMP cyclohydrolase [Alphaproteobacteria bacterium]|nr:phosphoribosyl-AMP cyclohydrolase [Alphaproteobacteria bacterium]MCD8571252.1 phosphoribosyl-AMP cyclohydrolase [Alphaproteobacteria bacterium]
MDSQALEEGQDFTPRFGVDGLMPCITVSAASGKVLMLAYMNELALQKTLETGEAHYWSRSRNELWHKGATSGQVQKVLKILTDCDQDCLLIHVDMPQYGGAEKSCHTGRESCFYREVMNSSKGQLRFI